MTETSLRRTIWSCAVLLSFLGFGVSVTRGIGVFERAVFSGPPTSGPAPLEREGTVLIGKLTGVERGTAAYGRLENEFREFFVKFDHHPVVTLLHVLPAALLMVLAPLQFSSRVRGRAISWHRWSGRLLIALGIPIGLTGLFFGVFLPFAGGLEASAIAFFGVWFLIALVRGLVAIRNHDIALHREWMIRMFSVAIGVLVVRLTALPLAVLTRAGPSEWFGQSVWLGFSASVLVAELWIRRSRSVDIDAASAAAV